MTNKVNVINVLLFLSSLVICVFILMPLVIIIIMSFNPVSYSVFPPEGISIQWYKNLVNQPHFLGAFKNSILTSIGATIIALISATLAVIALDRYSFPGKNILRAFYMSPMVVPKITLGIAFLIYFNQINMPGGIFGLIVAESVAIFPFVLAVVSGSYAQIDKVYEAAAADLGARPFRIFYTVTLPQLKSALYLSSAISFIFTFDQLELALLLLRPQNYTLPVELFIYMEKWQDPTIAVISTLMMGIAVFFYFGMRLIIKLQPQDKKML